MPVASTDTIALTRAVVSQDPVEPPDAELGRRSSRISGSLWMVEKSGPSKAIVRQAVTADISQAPATASTSIE
jgi:hypothetical protein